MRDLHPPSPYVISSHSYYSKLKGKAIEKTYSIQHNQDLPHFNTTTTFEEHNLLPNPVDILSFENIFIESDIAPGLIFKGKRSRIINDFTVHVDLCYK